MARSLHTYRVAAFVGAGFDGNRAAVCLLPDWLPVTVLQSLALQIGLPETVFLKKDPDSEAWDIRWFTPEIEMDLCGHATLAAAFVLFNGVAKSHSELIFSSASGKLEVANSDGLIILNFPAREPQKSILPEIILKGIGVQPLETYKSRDYVLIFESEEVIRRLSPDRTVLDGINLDPGGIIVTARGNEADFVSRYFTPQASIFEDPVTGSAHCSLIPYWSRRLNKSEMIAEQLSESGGIIYCGFRGDRVNIAGQCRIYDQQAVAY